MKTELCIRTVHFPNGYSGQVSLNRPLLRCPANPLLTPRDVNRVWTSPSMQVSTVHNAAVARFNDEYLMLFRSHLRCGKSVLGLTRSVNGIDQWKTAPHPVLKPARESDHFSPGVDIETQIEMESGGIEDPRITFIENRFAITYSAYHSRVRNRVRVCLATTQDFQTFVRHGPMMERDMRNVVLFGEPLQGRYWALFRPNDITEGDTGGSYTEIRLGWSSDWTSGMWRVEPEPIMKTGKGPSAFSDKIGPGAPPVKTDKGWLNLFHGVRTTMDGNPYVLGIALHDTNNPGSIQMSSIPILFPTRADCRASESDYVHVPNVVFSCAMLRGKDGTLLIYYGGNDTVMNCAASHEDVLIELCKRYGQDPLTGELLYNV